MISKCRHLTISLSVYIKRLFPYPNMEYARVHSIPLRSKFISCFSSDLLLLQLSLASHCIASMPSHSCILNHHRHRSLPLPLPLHLSRRKRLSLPPTTSLVYSPRSRFDCASLEVLSALDLTVYTIRFRESCDLITYLSLDSFCAVTSVDYSAQWMLRSTQCSSYKSLRRCSFSLLWKSVFFFYI